MKKKVFRERYYGEKTIIEDAKTEENASKPKVTRKSAFKKIKGDK